MLSRSSVGRFGNKITNSLSDEFFEEVARQHLTIGRDYDLGSTALAKDDCALDFLSLGFLVHRLDPGRIPFRIARSVAIHVSGGEYNVAANLAGCFGLTTGIATATVDYGIGELVQTRVMEK